MRYIIALFLCLLTSVCALESWIEPVIPMIPPGGTSCEFSVYNRSNNDVKVVFFRLPLGESMKCKTWGELQNNLCGKSYGEFSVGGTGSESIVAKGNGELGIGSDVFGVGVLLAKPGCVFAKEYPVTIAIMDGRKDLALNISESGDTRWCAEPRQRNGRGGVIELKISVFNIRNS